MGKARLLGENIVTPQAPQNKVGKLTGITQSALQGLTLGSADELQGLVAGLYSKFAEGKDFQTAYNETVDAIRSDLKAFREQEPVYAYGSEIAGSLPTAIFGGARLAKAGVDAVKSAGLMGGAYGGLGTDSGDPVDRVLGTGVGALAGGTIQKVAPFATEGAKELIKRGVPVTVGDAVGGGLKKVEEAMTSVPFVGSAITGAKQRAKKGFDKAIFQEVLEPLNPLLINTKNVLKGLEGRDLYAKTADIISDQYDKILPKLKMPNRSVLQDKFDDVILNEAEALSGNAQKLFLDKIDKIIYSKFDDAGKISGQNYKKAISEIRREVRKFNKSTEPVNLDIASSFSAIESAMADVLKSTNPAQALALDAIDKSFRRLLPVERAVIASEGGEFTADQILRQVRSQDRTLRKKSFARGEAEMQPLVEAGQNTIKQRLANSGTADRSMLGTLALGGGLAFDPLTVGVGSALTVPAYSKVGVPLVRDFTTRGIAPVLGRGAPFYGGLLGQNVQDANFLGMNRR
tara:strand:- start:2179 stop:3729 length:1551 start_codon:yes stop_codon:yes gene_type:complete